MATDCVVLDCRACNGTGKINLVRHHPSTFEVCDGCKGAGVHLVAKPQPQPNLVECWTCHGLGRVQRKDNPTPLLGSWPACPTCHGGRKVRV